MEKQKSIYEEILRKREEDATLPYTFQDPETAGREDTLFILMTEGISYTQKEEIALQCCQILLEVVEKKNDLSKKKLNDFLGEFPMRLFFIELRERLRVLIEHDKLDVQELQNLGMRLTRNSHHLEEVKLGIMLLGFSLNDLTQKILRIVGYHSDFTIYVAESIKNSSLKENSFIFELLQHTDGYGKLAALFLLKPVLEEQKKWVIHRGIKSGFLSSVYVNIALQKTDIRHYLFYSAITKENYQDFLYVLAYREPNEEEHLSDEMILFMRKIVEAREHATTFIEQAGLVMIWLQIIDSWKQDYTYLEKQLDQTEHVNEYWDKRFKDYEEMIRMIEVFLNKAKWQQIALNELTIPKETDYLIVSVLQFLEMKPEMSAFYTRLSRNPLGLNLLDFFLANHANHYFSDVCDYLSNLLSDQLFELPFKFDEGPEQESRDLFKVNIWLETLLKTMLEKELFDMDWCLDALNYYHPKIRRLALQVLRKYQENWDEDEVFDALEDLFEFEENKKNIRLLRRLLQKESEGLTEERRTLPVKNVVTEKLLTDKKLLDTYIAGMSYHDLSIVEELIKKGKILQLVREKENEYDRFAIAITLENGYLIGYVPRADNRVLATLLDNEEVLYAEVEVDDLEEDETMISIHLRKKNEGPLKEKPRTSANVVQFPSKKNHEE